MTRSNNGTLFDMVLPLSIRIRAVRYSGLRVLTVDYPALHPLFETLGYAGGFTAYRAWRRSRGDVISVELRWAVTAAAAVGALLGSRILGLLEQSPRIDPQTGTHLGWHWAALLHSGGGKTIVGGLLGGWLAVELAKLAMGIRSRTGDLFAIPLCIGIAIGRIGCFFAGIADDTYGKPTTLPWGINFGDGLARHPTQLYEMSFLLTLALALDRLRRRPHREGTIFAVFMAAYLGWRLFVDFLKPQPLVHGLNMIQWACLAGLIAVVLSSSRSREVPLA